MYHTPAITSIGLASSSSIAMAPLKPLTLLALLLAVVASSAKLSPDFYQKSCPSALPIIRDAVKEAVAQEARMGASLLRLHFHDCFVNGCDGSVLLDDNSTFTGEKTAPPNKDSLRGFDVVDSIKSQLEQKCPGIVSCADILAVAARDSTFALGGPNWDVLLGRRDSLTASFDDANSELPSPDWDLDHLISHFAKKGLTTDDMVALSGAHTIGQARCSSFRSRIYNDTDINSAYTASLKSNCPSTTTNVDNNLAALDIASPTSFDNAYYANLFNRKGLLHSDQQLYGGKSTDSKVLLYSSSTSAFYSDFEKAMIKMGNFSPLTGIDGEIRTNCRVVRRRSEIESDWDQSKDLIELYVDSHLDQTF